MRISDEIWAGIQQKVADFDIAAAEQGLYHRGYRFWPPYACYRCGEPISAYQFAFSRSCGGCDVGHSLTARLSLFDPRWFILGKAELENSTDTFLIHPEFVPAHKRREFRRINPAPGVLPRSKRRIGPWRHEQK